MTQHAFTIANQAGAAFRSDIVAALQAGASNNLAATAPATMYAGMWWPDTTSGWLKQRNVANSGWIFVHPLGGHAEVDVAAAAAVDLGAQTSDLARITGTGGPITSFGTADAGRIVKVRHSGAAVLTHNATSLILPGGANITTAAGDTYEAESLGSGNWVVRAYQRADEGGYFESVIGTFANAAATSTFADIASITPGPGRWDIRGMVAMQVNGATISGTCIGAIGTSSVGAGVVPGQTSMEFYNASALANSGVSIPAFGKVLTASTTFYLLKYATYSAGIPKFIGSISARRVGP